MAQARKIKESIHKAMAGGLVPYDYPENSLDIQAQLMMLGLSPNHLMLMRLKMASGWRQE